MLERRERVRESRQGVGVMKTLPRGKENLERLQMGSAIALMSKQDILCEKQGKVNEAYQKLQDGWLSNGDKVPPADFAKLASEYTEAHLGRKAGTLDGSLEERWLVPFKMWHLALKLELQVHLSSQHMGIT